MIIVITKIHLLELNSCSSRLKLAGAQFLKLNKKFKRDFIPTSLDSRVFSSTRLTRIRSELIPGSNFNNVDHEAAFS